MPLSKHKISFFNETKYRIPRTGMIKIFNALLKKNYSLNVIFVKPSTGKKLNNKYRGKQYIPNILTFPTDSREIPAEIYITPDSIDKDTKNTFTQYILFLYIHGILHALGHKHGNDMEKLEDVYYKKYV